MTEKYRGEKYYLENRDIIAQKRKENYDKEKNKINSANYYQKNKELVKARAKLWKDKNRDKVNERARVIYKEKVQKLKQEEII